MKSAATAWGSTAASRCGPTSSATPTSCSSSTSAGLAFFGEQFALPFPQERYDQVFVPNMGGAMENWGCVTWSDHFLHRSDPSYGERALVANVLLHEMAHMWFGDLVTMRWWDDLWLNEAFASWAATWASVNATRYTDGWATFLASRKIEGYRVDMGPASHPIRGAVPDVAQAMANFDAITYLKGQGVLKQLVAHVGEPAFVEGLRSYFADHAWGNTRLADLMQAVGTAAGRDLSAWATDWFDRAGTDTLTLSGPELCAVGPEGDRPRPHHLTIASFRRHGDRLEPLGRVPVDTTGPRTPVELPEADLHLVNDQDLTFAAVRADEASLRTLLESAPMLPEPLSRAVAVSTVWDMLLKGELATDEVLTCLLAVLAREESPGLVESFLRLARQAAEHWTRPGAIPAQLARVAAVASDLVLVDDHRTPALRTLAASATEPDQFAVLDEAATQDLDLAWRVLTRRSAVGAYDAQGVAALLERDPDPDAEVRALGVLAARPDDEATAHVWAAIFEKRSVPLDSSLFDLAESLWRPTDRDRLLPWAHRYLDEVELLGEGGMLATSVLIRATLPTVVDQAFLDRATTMAQAAGVSPSVRATLLDRVDTLARMLRASG